jgi:hypothetical protein
MCSLKIAVIIYGWPLLNNLVTFQCQMLNRKTMDQRAILSNISNYSFLLQEPKALEIHSG